MNKLDYPENIGKIFLRNLEMQFLRDGIDEAFAGVLSTFSDPSQKKEGIILRGCEVSVSGSLYAVTEGYIYMLGEVFRVEAHQISVNGGETVYFDIEETDFDSNWPAPIEGGGSHQTRKKRVGKLKKSSTPPNDRMGINAPTLEKKIMDAATPPNQPKWFDPRLEGKTVGDYFNQLGEGIEGKLYEGWILLGVYAGTEDYIGKAIVNRDNGDIDLDTVGKTYGTKEHKLTGKESGVQNHTHGYQKSTDAASVQKFGSDSPYTTTTSDTTDGSGYADAEESHNNMQPSIVACLIARKSAAAYYV